jgi:putative tryptophan/tyrosine transport system substrate-binding protein
VNRDHSSSFRTSFGFLDGRSNNRITSVYSWRFARLSGQQPAKFPRIGYVSGGIPNNSGSRPLPASAARPRVYRGENILVDYRYVEGKLDRYPSFPAELLQLKVDILVVAVGVSAAKRATKRIPIVMVTTGDPLRVA